MSATFSLQKLEGIPRPVRWFLVASAIAASICLGVEFFCVRVLHLGYPYDYPLLYRHPSFDDFNWYFRQFQLFHTAAFFQGPDVIMYPAPAMLCFWFFYSFHSYATAVFLGFIVSAFLVGAAFAVRVLYRCGLSLPWSALLISATCLLCYPAWFELKQANMEIVLWVLLVCGMAAVIKERFWAAAVFFAFAAALKFYPVILFGLLLSRKRYRELSLGLALAGLVMLCSLWIVGPTVPVAWHGVQSGLKTFRENYILPIRGREIGFDHSLYAVVKIVQWQAHLLHFASELDLRQREVLLDVYLAVMGTAGTAVYFFRIRKLPVLNQMFCLVVACILLPPVSYDYTLLHLYFPWLMLCGAAIYAARARASVPGLGAMFICLGLATAPLSEVIHHARHNGGIFRSLLLLAIFTLALRFPFALPEEAPALQDA